MIMTSPSWGGRETDAMRHAIYDAVRTVEIDRIITERKSKAAEAV